MFKNIKKSLKYVIIILGVIIMLPTLLYLLLQTSEVQTFLINRISKHFSGDIRSSISVGRFEYKFFNRISINDILIKDHNNDTLIYSEKVTAGIRNIDFKNKYFRLGRVILLKPVVAFKTDSSGLMNLSLYLDMLKNPGDSVKTKKTLFFIDQVDISDARFSLINQSVHVVKSGIDFNNLSVKGINGIVESFKVQNDTTTFEISDLGFKESTGFSLISLKSSVSLAGKNILFNSASLHTDSTLLNIARLGLYADSSSAFRSFTDRVKLDILLEKSLVNSYDLQYFIPLLNEIQESVYLSGRILGTISELRGRNIEFNYRDSTYIDCDFDLSGLPKIENAFIYLGINSLTTNAKDIDKIKIPGKGFIVIPDLFYKIGNITFDGSFTGFTTDFVTYGKISTNLGRLRTDISFRPEESNKYRIKGLVSGTEIDLGELTGKSDLLGNLSMNVNVDGYAYSLNKFAANLTGKIDSLEINRYKYRNIALNGFFTEKTWDGSINIADDNIKLDLLGMFNFKNELPEFDFTLNLSEANLFNLNFDRFDTTSSLTMLLTSNFKGSSIDNLDGEIKLLNSNFKKFNNTLELYDFSIKTFSDNNIPVLSLRTDFLDAEIKGYYNFATLGGLIKSTLANLMPSKFTAYTGTDNPSNNKFTFEINFKNSDMINNFFRTGILVAEKSYLKGSIFSDSLISVTGNSGLFTIKNNVFKDFALKADVSGSELSVDINSTSLAILKQSELKGFSLKVKTIPDNFIFTIDWDNKDKVLNSGKFIATGSISKRAFNSRNAIFTINIDSTHIFARNNLWKIGHSIIVVDSNAINIRKLNISNNDRFYMVTGAISENPADTLNLKFRGIDISPLNYLGNKNFQNDPGKIPLNLKGSLNGTILLNDVYNKLLLESDIIVNDFSLLGSEYGKISINSTLDITRKVININASNNLDGQKMIDIAGYYDPAEKLINLNANASKLPIDALNPLLKIFASGITGFASGKVNLSGESNNLALNGAVLVENASLKIDYLQTKFKLNDSIRFDNNGIKFNNIRLIDEKGSYALLSGSVNHKSFKDFRADLIINIQNPNQCLVLNTKSRDNELFYGTAYTSGVTTIKSGPNALAFDISAKTGKNTKFFIPLNTGLSVSEYSFVSFVESDVNKNGDPVAQSSNSSQPAPKQTGMELNFDLEVTPDAEVQLIFDSKVGDVMKGHGSGDLNINLNKKGEFKISGDYIVDDGDYLFTLGNILNKSFSVENGGKIIFNGDIDNSEIDIKAIYKLKTSLFPIIQDEAFSNRIDVECQLFISGNLFNPIVRLNIELPNTDEQTRAYLKNAVSTEEELSRQFLYLLVMNSFYSDPSIRSTASSSVPGSSSSITGTSAMAVTTTEMLSNQLSNWLSQISNDFDIGFVYRPGTKDLNSQEVQVALSTQLLNDKVIINGNFDVRGTGNNADNANQITGDFDAEVKITEKIRLKVFNRYNNPYVGKTADYTQGIGIFFKEDFDKFSDLFRKKIRSEMKKEEDMKIEEK